MSDYSDEEVDDIFDSSEEETYEVSGLLEIWFIAASQTTIAGRLSCNVVRCWGGQPETRQHWVGVGVQESLYA